MDKFKSKEKNKWVRMDRIVKLHGSRWIIVGFGVEIKNPLKNLKNKNKKNHNLKYKLKTRKVKKGKCFSRYPRIFF